MNASLVCSKGISRVPPGRTWRGVLAAAGAAVFLAASAARAATIVQEFYLPMPEQQIYQANSAIIGGTSATNLSTFSVVVSGSGTVIYYDHWEDGYEINLSSPTQPS